MREAFEIIGRGVFLLILVAALAAINSMITKRFPAVIKAIGWTLFVTLLILGLGYLTRGAF